MSEQKTIREKAKAQLDRWKTELEDLNVQLRLGRAEAEDAFEEQKKKFSTWLDKRREQLDELEDSGEDYVEDLKDRLEKLRDRLRKGKVSDTETFDAQKQKISAALDEAEEKLEATREKGSVKAQEVSGNVQDTLSQLRTQLDLFWLKFNLGKADMQDEVEERSKKAASRVQELKNKLEASEEVAEDRWDHFKGEMKEAFNHLRKAFQGKE